MMNRRDFLIDALAVGCAMSLSSRTVSASAKPNILILITDEQSADAASYRIGTKYLHTPNMDSVAALGTVFTRAYCANPLCVPSRTSMFTGRYPTSTGVMDNDAMSAGHLDTKRFPMMGTMFKNAGYETAYFGKWHMPCPVDDHALHGFSTVEAKMIDTDTASNATKFLKQKHRSPFLAVASFLNPHNICEWARGQKLPLGDIGQPPPAGQCPPLRANHAPQIDEPDIMVEMRRSYQDTPMFPVGDFSASKWRQYQWAYYRLIEKVDAQIGIVLDALRSAGLEHDTLIAMVADHGDCQGAHGWNQKTVFYEESSRVPFVLSWPGVIVPGKSDLLVNTGTDLIPTLASYTEMQTPADLPGLSVKSAAAKKRRFVVASNRLAQGATVNGRKISPFGRMLCNKRFKYCAYSEGDHRESLVDLKTDPGEMVNLAQDPRHHATLIEHRAWLATWCKQAGDLFDVPGS